MTCPACGHQTMGDLIVARATAGAARVDAERALLAAGRTGTVAQRAEAIEAATERLAEALATEEAARAAEQAFEDFESRAAMTVLARTPLKDTHGASMVPVHGESQ